MKRWKWKKLGVFALSFVLAASVSYYPGTVLASQTETEMTEGRIETEPESTKLETEQLPDLQTESTAPETEQLPEATAPETQPETITPETEQSTEPEESSETQTEDKESVTEDFTDGTETETSQPEVTEDFTDNPVSESVKAVQALIEELPGVEELNAMSIEEQQEVYEKLQTAYDAYFVLSDEEKALITGAEVFESLFAFFNSGISMQADPVSISNAAELKAFRDRVNEGVLRQENSKTSV